jgi:beta-lactamase class A
MRGAPKGDLVMKQHVMLSLAATMLALATPVQLAAQQEPPATVSAQQITLETRADDVVALLNGKVEPGEVFSQSFQAAIPAAQIKALSANLTAQFGVAVAATLTEPCNGSRAGLEIRFERGLAKGSIAIDPAEGGRISELLIASVDALVVADDTPAKIAADLAALPGSVNAWFGPLDGSAPMISVEPQRSMALGSTFKLYVLAALAEDVKAGRRKWTDVVALTEKSYPSGQLQDWPSGAPVTLHTLASLMISISDNTATDQLIAVLGRNRILQLMVASGHADPWANDQFLTTRELFMLKADPDLTAQWLTDDEALQIGALNELASRPNAPLDQINAAFANGPKALDIEWFASPSDLAKLLAHMRRTGDAKVFDIMAINPSATNLIKEKWDYIGFKGGSEPGVMNLTWLLRDKAGRDHILTLGWNNSEAVLDEGKLLAIGQRILLLPR